MKDKIKSKLIAIKNFSTSDLPGRTKIFLSALWFWTYLLYYFTKFINIMLYIVVVYTPDSCVIFRTKLVKNKKIPEILNAKIKKKPCDNKQDDKTSDITNKLNILLNWKWDDDIGDIGGIKIKELISKYPSVSSSIIWISYLFEIDKKLETMSDEEVGKSIKYMLINISDKVMYRDANLKTPEDILFGEIPFD